MEKIDVKDRKILYQLDLNSRQSFSRIGKKVGLHKDVVARRVKKLQEKGIIKNFNTAINTSKLGFIPLRFYFKFQYATPEIKEEIIDYFVKCKYIQFVHLIEGSQPHDVSLVISVKNLHKFYNFWEKTLKKYLYYFDNLDFSVYVKTDVFGYTFLVDNNTEKKKYEFFGDVGYIDIDDFDNMILKLIVTDSRLPTIDIAKKLNSTAITVNNRIKKLLKSGVILGFRANIDFQKIGYKWFKVFLNLKDYNDSNPIIDYLINNYDLHSVDRSIGNIDLQLHFILKDVGQLHQIINDISNKFPDKIKNYTYHNVIKSYKWNYLPED